MYRVAWLTCALLALAAARVYERCELARELLALGVRPDHVSTWVCIAYHESRFDTAAKNHYSGDHGIFQISELYWCGPGKACGLPCSALRDDDISNDLECALQVHEEHTRLQGNGFLAWVVYPQHCKHNTKKYLVDCDTNVKYTVPITRSRPNYYEDTYKYNVPNNTYNRQNIENLLPPYLAIGSIFRGNYGKVLDQNRENIDWYNYKIKNIDELKLPVFDTPSQPYSMPPVSTKRTTTTSTTTTTTTPAPYIPRVKVWRTIETNQFRKKRPNSDNTTPISTTTKDYANQPETTPRLTTYTSPTSTARPSSEYSTTAAYLQNATLTTLRSTSVTTTSYSPTPTLPTNRPEYTTTTQKPTTTTIAPRNTVTYTSRTHAERPTSTISRNIETTTNKPRTEKPAAITIAPRNFVFTTTYRPRDSSTVSPTTVTIYPRNTVTTTYRPWTSTTEKPTTTTLAPRSTTYNSWFTTSVRPKSTTEKVTTTTSLSRSPVTTTRPWFTTTVRPTASSITPRNFLTTTYRPWFTTTSSTTEKPTTTTFSPRKIASATYRPSTTTTQMTSTRRPTTVQVRNTVRTTASTTQRPVTTTNKAITKTDFSWYTFTSRTATTPPTTKQQSTLQSSTPALPTQTKTNAPYAVTQPVRYTSSSQTDPTRKPRTTQSIFDLYLNPTKPPKLPRYSPPENKYRLKIFEGGTTTPPSVMQSTKSIDPAKNYIRRQALRESHDK